MSLRTVGLGAAILANVALAGGDMPTFIPVNSTESNNITPAIHIDSENRVFRDDLGGQRMFHGVNVVYKVDPYIPSVGEFDSQNSLNDEDIGLLKKWGMNFVRLGVMWEAVERSPGVYDDAYLDKVEEMIMKLGEAGIYTLVDAHQDVFARTICGEGVPDFYAKEALKDDSSCINGFMDRVLRPFYNKFGICTDMDSFGFRKDENDDPLIEDCQSRDFYTYYMTKQSMAAFGHFFTNKNGMQDKFVDYWAHVAQRFATNPYVIGYDPLNEPFPANPAKDPMLLTPGHMDKTYLAPLYENLFEKYEKKQMWFEPVPFPDEVGFMSGYVFPVGFDTPPGGEIGSDLHVLNDHTYCCQLSADECVTGEPQVAHADKCLKWHEKRIGQRAKDAERLGLPLFITEFGACLTEGPCSQEINQVGDVADENLVGWAYWQFKTYADLTTSAGTGSEGFWNQDGTLQDYKVKALARAYLQVTTGKLDKMTFDTTNADFTAEFTYSTESRAYTTAYLNQEYWYTNGSQVTITVNGAAVDPESIRVHLLGETENDFTYNIPQIAGIKDGDKVVLKAVNSA